MKKVIRAFLPFISEISHDFMLVACIVGPALMGFAFHSLLPLLEQMLCEYFGAVKILAPYYIVFDLLLAVMTPILFCFAGVLVILEELDCGVAKYYAITPLGKNGYLFSRLGITTLAAMFYDIIMLNFLCVSDIGLLMTIALSLGGGMIALVTSLFVVAFAKNKMEGIALVKLCGILIIGIPVAYFVSGPVRYLFGVFPSFWIAELCITGSYLYFVAALLTSCIMFLGLYDRFRRKLL